MNITLIINLIGWMGAAALLIAYALVSLKNYKGTSIAYQFLNILGSAFLVINTIYYQAYPSAFVNIVWIGIAVFSVAGPKMRVRDG